MDKLFKKELPCFICLMAIGLFCAVAASGQGTTKTLQIGEVGWTLHIPSDARLPSKQVDSTIKANQHENAAADFDGPRVLFNFTDPPFNTFASMITHFDASLSPRWMSFHHEQEQGILNQIIAMKPRIQIKDTASAVEMIDGLAFQRYYIKTYYPQTGATLYTYNYARQIRGYNLMIIISYTDEAVGRQYRSVLKASAFKP